MKLAVETRGRDSVETRLIHARYRLNDVLVAFWCVCVCACARLYVEVAWLDADTFFTNERWVSETSELLNTHQVVQPFAFLVRMPPALRWLNPSRWD